MIVVVVVLAVLVMGAFVGFRVLQSRARAKPEDPFYHFRCPDCHRRLRYQARQVGRKGQCPTCRHALTFPPLTRALD
jgi:hypothetical protein